MEERRPGRPSRGRSIRLQFTATTELDNWLESQRSGNETKSDVIFRMLTEKKGTIMTSEELSATYRSLKNAPMEKKVEEAAKVIHQARADDEQMKRPGFDENQAWHELPHYYLTEKQYEELKKKFGK